MTKYIRLLKIFNGFKLYVYYTCILYKLTVRFWWLSMIIRLMFLKLLGSFGWFSILIHTFWTEKIIFNIFNNQVVIYSHEHILLGT
jgi:hypothetical protein